MKIKRTIVIQQWQSDRRKKRLSDTADKYLKIPAILRELIASEAGVVDYRLDKLPPEDRAALYKAVKKLKTKLDHARNFLLGAQTLE